MNASLLLLGIALLAACGAGDEETGRSDAGQADASNACPSYAAPSWLTASLDTDLKRLSGAEVLPVDPPFNDGSLLVERSTLDNRQRARQYLLARLTELGLQPEVDDYGSGQNPFAIIPATQATTEAIVIGAHFDTVPNSPGANDNATGVAMTLAAARFAAEMSCRRYHLVVAFFDEEEIGLVGSQAFAAFLNRGDLSIRAVHTIDQNGWDADLDRGIELERDSGEFAFDYVAARTALGLDIPIHLTQTGSTDHVAFRLAGLPAIGVTEEFVNGDTTPHYHLPSDSYETVDIEYLASTTGLVLRMLFDQLGSSIQPPSQSARVPMPTPGRRDEPFEPLPMPLGCRQTTPQR